MEYTFYKISHPEYPRLVYIGSSKDYPKRVLYHEKGLTDETYKDYNKPLYKFVREKGITF